MNIKKGDTAKIITGKDKGKSGKVTKVFHDSKKIALDGLNLYKKHVRPKKQGEKGELVEVSRPIPISNVMIVCSTCKKQTRTSHRVEGKGKTRVCKKCGAGI